MIRGADGFESAPPSRSSSLTEVGADSSSSRAKRQLAAVVAECGWRPLSAEKGSIMIAPTGRCALVSGGWLSSATKSSITLPCPEASGDEWACHGARIARCKTHRDYEETASDVPTRPRIVLFD